MTTSYTYKLIEAASKTWYQTESVFPGIQDNYSLNNCSTFFFYRLFKYSFRTTMIGIYSKYHKITKNSLKISFKKH